jgi:hypothetical protein
MKLKFKNGDIVRRKEERRELSSWQIFCEKNNILRDRPLVIYSIIEREPRLFPFGQINKFKDMDTTGYHFDADYFDLVKGFTPKRPKINELI